jgi:hypothetical protein
MEFLSKMEHGCVWRERLPEKTQVLGEVFRVLKIFSKQAGTFLLHKRHLNIPVLFFQLNPFFIF